MTGRWTACQIGAYQHNRIGTVVGLVSAVACVSKNVVKGKCNSTAHLQGFCVSYVSISVCFREDWEVMLCVGSFTYQGGDTVRPRVPQVSRLLLAAMVAQSSLV